MYDFNTVGPGAPMMAPRVDPLREEKYRKMKSTKIGMALILGTIGCLLIGALATPVPCIGALLGLGALGLGIAGYVMMIKGGDAIEGPHRTLVITSIVVISIAVFGSVVIAVMGAMASMGSLMGSAWDGTFTGQDLKDYFESLLPLIYVGVVTNILISIAFVLIFIQPSKKWGKVMIGIYIGLSVIMIPASSYVSYTMTKDIIDDIDVAADYDQEKLEEFQNDQTSNNWIVSVMRVPEYVLLLIIGFGALFNVKKMEQELEPKLDPRLYSINM